MHTFEHIFTRRPTIPPCPQTSCEHGGVGNLRFVSHTPAWGSLTANAPYQMLAILGLVCVLLGCVLLWQNRENVKEGASNKPPHIALEPQSPTL